MQPHSIRNPPVAPACFMQRHHLAFVYPLGPFGMLNLITILYSPYPRLKALHHPVLHVILALQGLHHVLIPCPDAYQVVDDDLLLLALAVQALIGLGV